MSEVPLWLERKFSFEFPVDVYPSVRIRLRGTPARLEELTRGLSREQLVPRQKGKWSIQENAGHLLDLEPLWFERLREFLAGAKTLTAADMGNTRTQEARHNEADLSEILATFRAARQVLVNRLDELDGQDFARVSHHPRLNVPMRLLDHLYFVAEHDDHHLARIWELRRCQ